MNDMMMGHRIVAKIHPDMTLVFIDGLDEINQNDYNRQVLTVYTDGWALSDNQTMHIAFSRAEDDEDLTETYINHVMMAYDQDERAYFVRLPKEVLSERGTWFFCISVRDSWDAETGAADNVSNTTIYQFHVRATLEDYSGDAPSDYDIAALYSTALSAVGAAQAARDAAKDTADQVSEDLEKVDEMYQALDDFEKNVMSAKEAAGIAELAAQSAAASASTAQTAVENIETSISEIEADVSDAKAMASAAQAEAESKYEKPSGGIPETDLSAGVQNKLNPNYKTVLIDIVYPVGSIYMSINNVSPATFFGGTWERIQDKFLLAAGSAYAAGSTGGSASHNHDYRISYLEGRNLGFNASVEGTGAYNYETGTFSQRTLAGAIRTSMPNSQERTETAFSIATLNGNTSIESSLPPYLAVYVWKRTE